MQRLNDGAGREVPVTVFGGKAENLDAYAELGIERTLISLETAPEDESIRKLDEYAGTAKHHL